ncbi:MAG: DUF2585 family protein [Planctomycetaceae bacterium]
MNQEPGTSRIAPYLRPISAMLLVLVIVTIQLRVQGRLWTCACGSLAIWKSNVISQHSSQHLFDPYAFTHVLHGVILFWGLNAIRALRSPAWKLWWCIALEGLWEILENSPLIIDRYRNETAALGYEGDTIINALGDIFSCALGFELTRRLGFRRSLAFFVGLELVLLFWIRDNLTLNVLMLVWPIEAIKNWQLNL